MSATTPTTEAVTPAPMIEIEGLVKQYGITRAVDGLTLSVPTGSIYGFVGPNGAGKTTTMRILATLISADSGRCSIGGDRVDRQAARVRARIGYMPDFFGVYDDLTVREYLEFYADSYAVPMRTRHTTILELLELVDLMPKQNAYVEGLSRGMKQRLGLARCLVHDPELLILDEPASGMDPRARLEMREIVKELRRLGKTILISSHILPELANLCTHIGIVQRGKLVRHGDVEAVMRSVQPGSTFEVRALTPRAAVVEVLQSIPAITVAEPQVAGDDTSDLSLVTFQLDADQMTQHRILRALVDANITVVEFAERRDNLEDVFMQITDQPET